jgi:hypothetical protein
MHTQGRLDQASQGCGHTSGGLPLKPLQDHGLDDGVIAPEVRQRTEAGLVYGGARRWLAGKMG